MLELQDWCKFFYYPSISENNCRPLDKRLLIDSKYFNCLFHIYLRQFQMALETIIDELAEIVHMGISYILIGSFGFLSIIILNGIIRSGRKGKRDMNKS